MKKYQSLIVKIFYTSEDVIVTSSDLVLSGKDEQGLFDSDIY